MYIRIFRQKNGLMAKIKSKIYKIIILRLFLFFNYVLNIFANMRIRFKIIIKVRV